MQSFKESTQLMWRGYKEVYELEPKLILISLAQGVSEGLFPFISLFFTSWIINILFTQPTFEELIPIIALALMLTFTANILANGLEHYRITLFYQAKDKKDMKMNNKVVYMDYEFIENTEVHELRNYLDMAELTGGQGLYYYMLETKGLINVY